MISIGNGMEMVVERIQMVFAKIYFKMKTLSRNALYFFELNRNNLAGRPVFTGKLIGFVQ
jgi:hypothetical protein